ncbi:MAG: aminoglycoside phosphotransferase family protein [Acidimicrobiales bacterium]
MTSSGPAARPPDPPPPGGRRVTLVLCSVQHGVLGALEPFTVGTPVWQEVGDVVAAARARFGLDVTVLRLLRGRSDRVPFGGEVVYLAEVDDDGRPPRPPVLRPLAALGLAADPLAPAPGRAAYAEPGGPAAELAWARARLVAAGRPLTGRPEQVRTWNLSSVWRMPTARGPVWLKSVPPFLAHEGPLLASLDGLTTGGGPAAVPPVLAAEPGRVLLDHVTGDDQYHARGPTTAGFLPPLIELQAATRHRLDELAALGVPDHRGQDLVVAAGQLAARVEGELTPADRQAVDRLLADLPRRLAALEACGLPATLVHGDFHPGNIRAGAGRPAVVLDWGDSSLGSPARDLAHLLTHLEPEDRPPALDRAVRCWQESVPGCDPSRAAGLARPLAALAAALAWQGFLDRIEPDERVYHHGDPAAGLARAAHLSAGSTSWPTGER